MRLIIILLFIPFGLFGQLGLSLRSSAQVQRPGCYDNTDIIDTDLVDFKLNWGKWSECDSVSEAEGEDLYGSSVFDLRGIEGAEYNLTSAIECFDGSKAQRSIYYEGECCYLGDGSGTTTGSGLFFLYDKYGTWDYDTIYLAYNIYIEEDFDLPQGMKLPGIRNYQSDGANAMVRFSLADGSWTSSPGEITPAFYHINIDDVGPVQNAKNLLLNRGEWINMCLMLRTGSVGGNGQMKMFINGVLISTQSLKFVETGHTTGFNQLKYETNMGGDNLATYAPDHDENLWIDDLVIGKPGVMWDSTYIKQSLPEDANFGR